MPLKGCFSLEQSNAHALFSHLVYHTKRNVIEGHREENRAGCSTLQSCNLLVQYRVLVKASHNG